MHKRQLTVVGIFLIAATILFVVTTYNQQAQDKPHPRQDEPTQIQEGVMTEKQRKHGKLYNRALPEGKTLTSGTGNVRRIIGLPFIKETSLEEFPSSQETFLRKVSCQSETIVTGEIKSKNAQLSEDKTSVFTDYEIVVKEILKNNSPSDVQFNKEITVTRSGGSIRIKNRVIEVIDKSYESLKVGGKYLFFLNYLNDSDSFNAATNERTFEILGNKIKRFDTVSPLYKYADENLVNVVDDIRTIAQQCFQKEGLNR